MGVDKSKQAAEITVFDLSLIMMGSRVAKRAESSQSFGMFRLASSSSMKI